MHWSSPPDLIIELGRGYGNSTCAFTEAANQLQDVQCRVLSLCISDDWERRTRSRVAEAVPDSWFNPLQALNHNILTFHWKSAMAGARRVLLFWDAHGFEVAGCVLGEILPALSSMANLVIMHDMIDIRYCSPDLRSYNGHELWTGNNWDGPRLQIDNIHTTVEQAVAAIDFTTRNKLTLDSADHSHHGMFNADPAKAAEMSTLLGDLFSKHAHWYYFTLNEHPGPYTFPRFTPPCAS
jgi:cephalosporin hydroxylase